LLKKILNDEIRIRSKTNLVKSKALLEMLENGIKRYNTGLLTTAEIIQFLVDEVAKKIKENDEREVQLGLSKDELAFYDALSENESAVQVLGDEKLRIIAVEVAEKVKANATIDWTIRESARAKLMVMVKRTLNKYGYPPDMQQKAIDTVLKQAELLADHFIHGIENEMNFRTHEINKSLNMEINNELKRTNTNSVGVSSFQFVRVSCLFISIQATENE
jgi:type I restriction enzyme R subunit